MAWVENLGELRLSVERVVRRDSSCDDSAPPLCEAGLVLDTPTEGEHQRQAWVRVTAEDCQAGAGSWGTQDTVVHLLPGSKRVAVEAPLRVVGARNLDATQAFRSADEDGVSGIELDMPRRVDLRNDDTGLVFSLRFTFTDPYQVRVDRVAETVR